jgi:hypothetical protein
MPQMLVRSFRTPFLGAKLLNGKAGSLRRQPFSLRAGAKARAGWRGASLSIDVCGQVVNSYNAASADFVGRDGKHPRDKLVARGLEFHGERRTGIDERQ